MNKKYKICIWLVSFILFFLFFFFLLKSGLNNYDYQEQENLIEEESQIICVSPEFVKVPILIYHQIRDYRSTDPEIDKTFIVPPENFKEQMEYLSENNYQTILFSDLKEIFDCKKSLPEKPIIITFDDGVLNQFTNALPILLENNYKAIFYIFINPIGKSKNYMSYDNLRELLHYGMEVGVHSYTHPNLTKISSSSLEKEIKTSKEILEKELGAEVVSFAYPFGAFNQTIIKIIKNSGYNFARGIAHGKIHYVKDFYNLDGYFITSDFNYFKNIVN